MIGTAHRYSGQSRIDNQSGYRVSLASYTAHSETPNDSNPNGEMIDAKPVTVRREHFVLQLGCSTPKSWSLETVEPASHWAVIAHWDNRAMNKPWTIIKC
ncbi:unnamed protein product [Penicillium camemberti]|uniref:Str. FM013 n=1 Tax=Penicillium camemberti (strain FM 013) TaxID=1429867 RepID=A0A0G4NVJ0_PENC3|nr:unnamed protein product [Penicillium camemberti]